MQRRLLFVALALVALCLLGCRNAGAQTVSASAMLVNGGATPLAVTLSFPVAHIKTGTDASLSVFVDTFLIAQGWGAGASVPVVDVLKSLRVFNSVDPNIGSFASRFRVGAALIHSGSKFDGGGYILCSVLQKSF